MADKPRVEKTPAARGSNRIRIPRRGGYKVNVPLRSRSVRKPIVLVVDDQGKISADLGGDAADLEQLGLIAKGHKAASKPRSLEVRKAAARAVVAASAKTGDPVDPVIQALADS